MYYKLFFHAPVSWVLISMLIFIGIPTGLWSLFSFTLTIGGTLQGFIIGVLLWMGVWWLARHIPVGIA